MKKTLAFILCAVLLLASVSILSSAAYIDPSEGLLDPAASYLCKGARVSHTVSSADATSIGFNKWNYSSVGAGDTVFLTRTGSNTTVGQALSDADGNPPAYDLGWWRMIVVDYDEEIGGYKVIALHTPDGNSKLDIVIPAQGFCVAIHNLETFAPVDTRPNIDISAMSTKNVAAFASYAVGDPVDIIGVPAPILPSFGLYETKTAPTIDGTISAGEYGDVVMNISPENPICDYFAFGADKYATGKFYATYDSQYLYLAWDIASEKYKHIAASDGDGDMWKVDCVQINIGALSTYDDHMLGATAQPWGTLASGYDCMIQLGIAVQADGTTRVADDGDWFANNKCKFTEAKATRNNDSASTVYEAKIALADINAAFANYDLTFEKGTEFALAFSINTVDDTETQRVLRLRDSGSIFGRNDYSKAPNAVLLGAKGTAPEPTTPDTGDSAIIFVVLSILTLGAGAVVLKKVR